MFYAFKFRLYPNQPQQLLLENHFGCCRYVYNYFLNRRNELYKNNQQRSNYTKDCAVLAQLKKELFWLHTPNAQSLQQELKNLEHAFKRFFTKQSEQPKFHSKYKDRRSFCVPQYITISGDCIYFPKFSDGIVFEQHRPIEGKIKHAVVSKNRSGQYFVSLCVEREIPKLPTSANEIGIDLGINMLLTCSNGQTFPNIQPYKNLEKKLSKLQCSFNKKQKDSKNQEKARLKLAKAHQKVANIRSNHLHQISKQIVNENQVICAEDLNVSGMRKNHKLAKSISDVSWYELLRQLEYKSDWYGRTFVRVDRFFPSSKTCSKCGFINKELKLGDLHWKCRQCGVEHQRDENACQTILVEGLSLLKRNSSNHESKPKDSLRTQARC